MYWIRSPSASSGILGDSKSLANTTAVLAPITAERTTTSSTSSSLRARASPSPTATRPAPIEQSAPAKSEGTRQSGESTNTTAIGAGVGAGLGVALLLVGAFFVWRRSKRRGKVRKVREDTNALDESVRWKYQSSSFRHSPAQGPHEVKGSEHWPLVEAPPKQTDPYELSGTASREFVAELPHRYSDRVQR